MDKGPHTMLFLLLAVVTPLLYGTCATTLSNTSAISGITDVLSTKTPLRDWEFVSSHVALSREEPTVRPSLEDSHAPSVLTACDMISTWVTDKRTAVDITGRNVTVLSEIYTPQGRLKQYFYEIKCRPDGATRNACRGVDQRYWKSKCRTAQAYVKALTMSAPNVVAWRWIRIDASCRCTISCAYPTHGPEGGKCRRRNGTSVVQLGLDLGEQPTGPTNDPPESGK
ncbi:neurotrophin-4-like [Elgaria multicarinata webbii]|uniref:neurotrophin-4-like n=1 Tax=Elgaria multicarinata webbii TaxID=159646 RepID=UPI002FCCDD04